MQACHLNAMLTYVHKMSELQAQSDLACGIDVAYLATSCKETVRRFVRIEDLPTWAEVVVSCLFCSVDLPHGDHRSCEVAGHVVAPQRSLSGQVYEQQFMNKQDKVLC